MSGVWYGIAAYSLWGLFPLYWKLVAHVPALELLAHRFIWSFVALAILAVVFRRRAILRTVSRGVVLMYAAAAVLLSINSFLYLYAVNAGFIVETSLGYYITPLVNVVLGVLVVRERLRPVQWLAVAIAAAGVIDLTVAYGALPWIACGLALSFGSYGLVKKKVPLDARDGLMVETAILTPVALGYVLFLHATGQAAFLGTELGTELGTDTDLLMIGGGLVTLGPLLLFAVAAQRVPLSVIGILQYIAPTIQFLLGVFTYHEPFSRTQLGGFAIVWMALLVFAADSLRARRVPQPVEVT
jgi:chloramphenicol-sensitive protein RarD